jgi:opacity protein-like surface antigen
MKRTLGFLLAIASATLLVPAARAADGPGAYAPYLGASFGNFDYQVDGQDKVSPKIGMFRLGVPLTPYLSLEGRVGTGISTDVSNWFGGYDLKIDSFYGGYAKANLPLSPVASIYGLAGWSGIKLRRKFAFADQTTTEDSFSFGGGVDFNLGSVTRLNVEWGRFLDVNKSDDRFHADILSIGLVWFLR